MPVILAPSPHQPKRALKLGALHPPAPSPAAENVTRSINRIIAGTRNPFGEPQPLDHRQITELERSLRDLEAQLAVREQSIQLLEAKLADRDRDLHEAEALLQAREAVLAAERQRTTAPFAGKRTRPATRSPLPAPSAAELKAVEKLKAELDAQAAALKDAKAQLREREQFLDDAENQLMSKMAAQQEKETELEQREEDLRHRENKFRAAAGLPPLAVQTEPMEKA